MEEEGMAECRRTRAHTHNTPLVRYIRRARRAPGEWEQERRSRMPGETMAGLGRRRDGEGGRSGGVHEEGEGNALSVCAKGNVRADEEGPARGGGIDARGGSNDVCEGGRRKSRERSRSILLLSRGIASPDPSFAYSESASASPSPRGGAGAADCEKPKAGGRRTNDGYGSEPAPSYENGASAVTSAPLGGKGGACDESDADADAQGNSEAGGDGGEHEESGDAQDDGGALHELRQQDPRAPGGGQGAGDEVRRESANDGAGESELSAAETTARKSASKKGWRRAGEVSKRTMSVPEERRIHARRKGNAPTANMQRKTHCVAVKKFTEERAEEFE
ncbi:hypothetical protein B0H14DRAFT_3147734 [Mycena olivaceomarginata]|nr:hypothetical protein B0H14DRAFT_3147734 [Mycena olivaceomarginata]